MSRKPHRQASLASALGNLGEQILGLRKQIAQRFENDRKERQELKRQVERTEQERREALARRREDQERYRREQDQQVLTLLRKMGQERPFILDILEEGQEADPAAALRDARAELIRWIGDVSGQRTTRFPNEVEAPEGLIVLAPDELADPDRGFDVGNEPPFAGGQSQVTFRVIRRGWRLGSQVLHPARLSAFGVPQPSSAEKEVG